MNWEVISATGEWAGAIAVVVSLLYLARQIRISNKQSRAAARYSFLDAYGLANTTISGSIEASSVFRRGLDGNELKEDEQMQFHLLIGQFLNTWSVMYDLYNEGELPSNQWVLVSSDIHAAFGTPGGKSFWSSIGRSNVHQDFIDYVDRLLQSGTPDYSISTRKNDDT